MWALPSSFSYEGLFWMTLKSVWDFQMCCSSVSSLHPGNPTQVHHEEVSPRAHKLQRDVLESCHTDWHCRRVAGLGFPRPSIDPAMFRRVAWNTDVLHMCRKTFWNPSADYTAAELWWRTCKTKKGLNYSLGFKGYHRGKEWIVLHVCGTQSENEWP